ncbi:hypothetical protein BH10ACT4_BH10ACT4_08970 [soil metagenome]
MANRRELPLSTPNIILVSVFLATAIAAAAFQSWVACVLTLLLAVGIAVQARLARRSESSDRARLNALEYRDERDRALARSGFSVVGGLALIVSVAEWIVASAVHFTNYDLGWATALYYVTYFQMLLFNVVWGRANRAATELN